MEKKLVMAFSTHGGSTSSLTLGEPKNNLTGAEVRSFMEDVISKNLFETRTGDLSDVKSAEIITTTKEILI